MQDIALVDKQKVFLDHVMHGDQLHTAAKKAGIPLNHADRDAYPLLMEPKVMNRIRGLVRGRAGTEGLVVCFNYMLECVRDEKLDRKTRLEAAKFLYAHHMPALKAQESDDERINKPVNEMTNQELRRFMEETEAALAERAVPVSSINPPAKLNL